MQLKLKQKNINKLVLVYLSWGIITYGFILRLVQFLYNRSLNLDEAFIASAIADGSFTDCFGPLEYSHIVPPGFFMVSKLFIVFFGNNDLTIRLFPFIAGSASLYLLYKVAPLYASRSAGIIALFLFSISTKLIYYTSSLKQYSIDIAAALLILLVVGKIRISDLSQKNAVILAFTGTVVIWFSHPSIFILAGAGTYLMMSCVLKKQETRVKSLLIIYSLWIVSFLFLYIVSLKGFSDYPVYQWLIAFWSSKEAFMPLSFSCFLWLFNSWMNMMKMLGGYIDKVPITVSMILFAGGCIALLIKQKDVFAVLLLPLVYAITASVFQKYPIHDRMLLFFIPALFLVIATGVDHVRLKYSAVSWSVKVILIMFLIWHPFQKSFFHLKHPKVWQEIKPVMAFVKEHMQPDDIIYLYYWAEPAFRYYDQFYGFDYRDFVFISPFPKEGFVKELDHFRYSEKNSNKQIDGFNEEYRLVLGIGERFCMCKDEIDKLSGNKRVWFIFSHNDPKNFINYLDKIGIQIDHIKTEYKSASRFLNARASSAYLYDLSYTYVKP